MPVTTSDFPSPTIIVPVNRYNWFATPTLEPIRQLIRLNFDEYNSGWVAGQYTHRIYWGYISAP